MEIVIGGDRWVLGGGTTYAATVAHELQRLGHEVTIWTPEVAGLSQDGLRVVTDERDLPDAADVVYAQTTIASYELAHRYPTTPQVFAVHADEYAVAVPPQLPGMTTAVVALSDRIARRIAAFALEVETVRLRQPVDTQRFAPRTKLRDPARKILLYGNYLRGDRRSMFEGVCAELGLECTQIGGPNGVYTTTPEHDLCEADIVVGKARTIVEALACGRAAYVFDHNGADGWVTPERYALLESDNFGGQAEPVPVTPERLRADLAAYRPEMGVANRDLAVVNHSANRHAQALVKLFSRLEPHRGRPVTAAKELARLARVQWATESRAAQLGARVESLAAERDAFGEERGAFAAERDALGTERDALLAERQALSVERERLLAETRRLDAAARAAHEGAAKTVGWADGVAGAARAAEQRAMAAEARADEAEARARAAVEREHALLTTRRVRIATALAKPLDKLRAWRTRLLAVFTTS